MATIVRAARPPLRIPPGAARAALDGDRAGRWATPVRAQVARATTGAFPFGLRRGAVGGMGGMAV
ncbi:hypothetical protein Sm713_10030 [Streptomyces sp. TS71-3]|nr:hypothetical protein Sm713_10030 [Streptomyces sp. TS71-3]